MIRNKLSSDKLTDTNKLYYSDFLSVVLDFSLSKHEAFLDGFLQLFQEQDTDHNGIINHSQFARLLESMDIGVTDNQTQLFLDQLDPFDFQKITFSDIIHLLSTQKPEIPPEHEVTSRDPLIEHIHSIEVSSNCVNSSVAGSEGMMPLSEKVNTLNLLNEQQVKIRKPLVEANSKREITGQVNTGNHTRFNYQ